MTEGGWLEPPESPGICQRDSERREKREASNLQSDIILKLVVNVRDNKNGHTGVKSEAHLPHTLACSSNQQMFDEDYENKSKHVVKVLQNTL